MNALFKRDSHPDPVPESTAYVDNAHTNTYGFALRPKGRAGVVPELTMDDLKYLAETELNNPAWFSRAKQVYSACGRAKDIRAACGCSLSSAKKMYRAFNRAKKGQ